MKYNEIKQFFETLQQFQDKPIIFCADLNIDRYSKEPAYELLITQFPDIIGQQYKDCQDCGGLLKHPYCPYADVTTEHLAPCITDTDVLCHNRFGVKTPVQCSSIDFFGSNKLKLKLSGSEYHYYLTDHHLMKGEII